MQEEYNERRESLTAQQLDRFGSHVLYYAATAMLQDIIEE
jgi:hypothetical protein